MVYWNLKVHPLKRPEAVPKTRNSDQKINDSKFHVWTLCINFRFFGRKSQSKQELAKKDYSFYNAVSHKKS